MTSSGVSTCSATPTPSRCSRARRSPPVARELFETKASARPLRWSAASVSAAPGLRTSTLQTQPARSKTKPRRVERLRAGTPLGLRPRELVDRGRVDLAGALGDAAPAEVRFDAKPSRAPHRAAARRIVEQAADRGRQRLGSGGLDEQAGLAVLDHLENAADRRGDDRRLARHRLQVD